MRFVVRRSVDRQSDHQPDTYAYQFEWTPPVIGRWLGSCHGLELPFVFGGLRTALLRVGLAAILGGAAGNLVDRIRLGHVIDFLDVYWRGHHWPAFNVADSAICVGVGLILLDAFRARKPVPSQRTPEAGGP